MNVTISMHAVVFGLIAALSLLCAVVYSRMRNQSALIWLVAALACGGAETVVLAEASVNAKLAVGAVTCLVPAAYLCLSQTIRALLKLPGTGRDLFAVVSGLTLLSLLLLALGAPEIEQSLPFQTAGAIALADSIVCLMRHRRKDVLDYGLLAVLMLMAVVVVVRMPLFPLLFDGSAAEAALKQSALQRALLGAAMITTPTSVFIIVAKIVVSVIAGHREQSERDYLTNLPNRRSLERAYPFVEENGGAMIVCDIDHFKQINDRYGHAVGDDIIRVLASLLHEPGGTAARIGGEEFALLLPGATVAQARARAETIRAKFHALRHPALARDHRLSASFGVASVEAGVPVSREFARADAALYRAKEAGRNCVVEAASPAPEMAAVDHAA